MSTTDARAELERIAAADLRRCNAGYLADIAKAYLSANPRRTGSERISAERVRQVVEEGWTPEHDRTKHADGSLTDAAAVLLLDYIEAPEAVYAPVSDSAPQWVFQLAAHACNKYDGQDRYRLLEVAGALIAAELDRLDGGAS